METPSGNWLNIFALLISVVNSHKICLPTKVNTLGSNTRLHYNLLWKYPVIEQAWLDALLFPWDSIKAYFCA